MSSMLAVVAEVVSHVTSRKQTDEGTVPAARLSKTFLGIGADFTSALEDLVEQATERFPHADVREVVSARSFKF